MKKHADSAAAHAAGVGDVRVHLQPAAVSNLLIRASAGTGKTFALATRFVRLMMFDGVRPEKIVALTFSRAAAQEIYTKLLERLWVAASGETHAARERETLFDGLDEATRLAILAKPDTDLSADGFRRKLRAVVSAQHLGTIATLDSFILRLVGNFPLESGFQSAVEVLDGPGETDALRGVCRKMLARTGAEADEFVEKFRAATKGKFKRTCTDPLWNIVDGENWRDFMLGTSANAELTEASMCAALGIAARPMPDLSAVPPGEMASDPRNKVTDAVAKWTPGDPIFPKSVVGEMMRFFTAHPDATAYRYETRNRSYEADCGAAGAAAIRDAVRWMADRQLAEMLKAVAAKLALVRHIDADYGRSMRRAGKLTFADMTRVGSKHDLELANIEYRFDAKFDHWALDEFQDTSEAQWACLRDLVEAAADDRSVIVVGDLKQSIYTWRGGNDAPFLGMMGWPSFATPRGARVSLPISRRYGYRIANFINRVFGPDNVSGSGIGALCGAAAERWLADICWMNHEVPKDADGQPKAGDYVKVVEAGEATDEEDSPVMRALLDELTPVWKAHEDALSSDTIGILVRKNDNGSALAQYLRDHDVPAVWEGMDPVDDVPAVRAVLQLLKLSEHPEDMFAWQTVDRIFPVRELVLPDATSAAAASAAVASDLSRFGLARTLKEYCGRLTGPEKPLDALSCQRLSGLVRAAARYEERDDGAGDLDGFVWYLKSTGVRETAASPRVVRILSIHRSKGLTLDRVFVPVFETEGSTAMTALPKQANVCPEGNATWILPHVGAELAALNPVVKKAYEAQVNARLLEQLRLYYVALTRSRKALYVILAHADEHAGIQVRDFIRHPFVKERTGAAIYEDGTPPAFAMPAAAAVVREPWRHDKGERGPVRLTPSSAHGGGAGAAAASVFGADYGAAAERGVEKHAAYEEIEWADCDMLPKLPEGFRTAFMKPSEAATVWRERRYEIVRDGAWETGQFDRVVFDGTGAATIYDFKTSARRDGETEAAFEARMRETYAGQMAAYRAALARLTGIAPGKIACVLLAEATQTAIAV